MLCKCEDCLVSWVEKKRLHLCGKNPDRGRLHWRSHNIPLMSHQFENNYYLPSGALKYMRLSYMQLVMWQSHPSTHTAIDFNEYLRGFPIKMLTYQSLISWITKPILGMFVLNLNAFLVVIPKIVMTLINFDFDFFFVPFSTYQLRIITTLQCTKCEF